MGLDKVFSGLIHTVKQALTGYPNYIAGYTKQDIQADMKKLEEKLERLIKDTDAENDKEFNILEEQVNEIDFVDEKELQEYFDNITIVGGGGAPIGEKGENDE